MRVNELGCSGCIGVIVLVFILLNIMGCIVGKIWDETQEVLAERHARQEVADARARERLAQEAAEREAAEARAAEARRIEADASERRYREEKVRREAADREAVKEDRLRTFALRDAPGIWSAYQQLEAAISVQNERIRDLAGTMKEFGRNPDSDSDYKSICVVRDEMIGSLKDIRCKLEEAYLASCRLKATPSQREYADLMHKVLEDGMQAADVATRKFEQMKVEK